MPRCSKGDEVRVSGTETIQKSLLEREQVPDALPASSKRRYHAPQLRSYGDLRDVTLSGSPGPPGDSQVIGTKP